MRTILRRLMWEEDAQDLVEYALLAGFISVATIGAMQFLASSISNNYNAVGTTLASGS